MCVFPSWQLFWGVGGCGLQHLWQLQRRFANYQHFSLAFYSKTLMSTALALSKGDIQTQPLFSLKLESQSAGCEPFSSLIFYTLRTFHSSKLILKKLLSSHNVIWCRERFIEYWVDQNMLIADTATRVFTVLKQPDKNYLTQVSFHTLQDVMWWTLTPSPGGFQASVLQILRGFSGSFEKVQMLNIVGIWHWWVMQEDFRPILRELLATHRGLEFLHDTPEFQERYGTDKATSFDRLCVGYELMNCVLGSYWPEEVHGL